ncbi:hypothetical protein KEJ37_05350 [Candidatus Bathyarchaeota archaeon]|nr:hypothetical protein [Candidatus Bathyarchaeota archaeon]
MEEEYVRLDYYLLKGISDIIKELEAITGVPSSVLVDRDRITIEQGFRPPTEVSGELSAERQEKFEKLVREISLRYLFTSKASRLIIEKDKLLIEFCPLTNIYKQ